MPTEEARVSFVIGKTLLRQLKDYRFENRYDSMSDAVRHLLEVGLKAEQDKKAPSPTKRRRGV